MEHNEDVSGAYANGTALALAPPELDDELRRIMEHINLEVPGEPSRTILVTGVQRGAGVSRIACWLSASLARASVGDVLYLNASPASFGHANGKRKAAPAGLLDLVREPDRCKAIYQKTAIANLFAMRAWTNPNVDMLHVADQHVAQALAMFKTRFVYIVIDAPAPLASPLTITLARHSGGTLVVVEANKTDCELVAETGSALSRCGVRIVGAVLNKGCLK